MIKKMMLLAVSAAAVLAFALPATASAGLTWSGTEIAGSGELTSVSGTGLVTGPAPIEFEGTVENGGSTGTIVGFIINNSEGGIPTNRAGCTAEATAGNLPWTVHLETPDTLVITDVTFTNNYSDTVACEVPLSSLAVAGDVTLTIDSPQSADADPYSDFSTLFLEIAPVPVDIQGQVSWEGAAVEGL